MKRNRDSVAFRFCCRIGAIVLLAATAMSAFAGEGDLDPSFGNGGQVITEVPTPGEGWNYTFFPMTESVLVQPDGKILVSGRFWQDGIAYWYGTLIVRYMRDGTLDPSFGTNGIVTVIDSEEMWRDGHAVGADMALQQDGKIVLIGQVPIAHGIVVQRYTSTGRLDTTFGDKGSTKIQGKGFGEGTSIAIQPDGKIVGVGWEYDPYATPYYDAILLFRLNPDGTPDATFGSEGNGLLFLDHGYDGPTVLIQPDAKIVVVGTFTKPEFLKTSDVSSWAPGGILRYNPDGSPDSSFGTGGRVDFMPNSPYSLISSAALEADGKIVASFWGGPAPSGLIRFNSDGTLDTSFGTNGLVSLASNLSGGVVLVQDNGRIIVTTNAHYAVGSTDFAILRLLPDGMPDVSFGDGGESLIPINTDGTHYASASAATFQRDGKLLVTGTFGNPNYADAREIVMIRVLTSSLSRRGPVRRGHVCSDAGREECAHHTNAGILRVQASPQPLSHRERGFVR